jgi:hypothetical protein
MRVVPNFDGSELVFTLVFPNGTDSATVDAQRPWSRASCAQDPGLTIFTYTADAGSRNEETLRLLGS